MQNIYQNFANIQWSKTNQRNNYVVAKLQDLVDSLEPLLERWQGSWVLTALQDNLSSVFSTYIWRLSLPVSSILWDTLFWPLRALTYTHAIHARTQTHIHTIQKQFSKTTPCWHQRMYLSIVWLHGTTVDAKSLWWFILIASLISVGVS